MFLGFDSDNKLSHLAVHETFGLVGIENGGLASCYYNGIGTKKDKKKAYKYYRAAVKMFGIYN